MKNEISLQKISARISLGMLLSILVTGSAWSAAGDVTSSETSTVMGHKPTMTQGNIVASEDPIGINTILTLQSEPDAWKFDDKDGDLETHTVYKWINGSGDVLQEHSISSTNTKPKEYKVKDTDLGSVISLVVTPKTNPTDTDPDGGDKAESLNTLTVMNANTVLSASISGVDATTRRPVVGNALTVTPSCAGVNNACGPVDDYTYKWLIEGLNDDGTGDDNYEPIANAESNTYTPTGRQQKRRIKAVVTNKSAPAPAPAPADVAAPTAKAKAKAKAKVTQ
jgi:hypothetical protein